MIHLPIKASIFSAIASIFVLLMNILALPTLGVAAKSAQQTLNLPGFDEKTLEKARQYYLALEFDNALALLEEATTELTVKANNDDDLEVLKHVYIERALNYFALGELPAASQSLHAALSLGFLPSDGNYAPEFREFIQSTASKQRAQEKGQLYFRVEDSDVAKRRFDAFLDGHEVDILKKHAILVGPHHVRIRCNLSNTAEALSHGEMIIASSGETTEVDLTRMPYSQVSTVIPPAALRTDQPDSNTATPRTRRRWLWPVIGTVVAVAAAGAAIAIVATTRSSDGTDIVIVAPAP